MNGLQTEESGKKSFSFKPFLIIGGILLVLIVVIFLVIILVRNINTKKDKKTTDDDNIVSLNSELDGTYSFAKEGDYIVALKKNGYNRRIYNLSQGTGNLGDFIDYTYYNKKLYFLFGSNNIYSISLNEGNGVYELEEEYTYTPVLCSDNSSGLTSNILVTDKIIYFNNSGCGISGFNYKKKGKQVNVSTFNSNKYSSITHGDAVKKLFYQADNSLYAVNEANGEITKVLDNVNGSINLSITDNVLLYASTSDNKNYTSKSSGTLQSYLSRSIRIQALISRALLRPSPQGRTISSIFSGSAAAKAATFGYLANRSCTTTFTRASVHCAARRTSTSSCQACS